MGAGTVTTSAISIGLLAHSITQFQHDPNWWLYVPSYTLAAIVCLLPRPSYGIWRILSALSIVGGGGLMCFLASTFLSLSGTPMLELSEGKNLLPVSLGVALTTLTRLGTDNHTSPLHYFRSLIFIVLLIVSIVLIIGSSKYYQTVVTV